MMMTLAGLVLDMAVLLALAGTIYYTMRLARSLNSFRDNREELKGLIGQLGQNINDAQQAIEGLKKSSRAAEQNLDEALHDARKMADELRLINQASDTLASRLEKLAERNRMAVQGVAAAQGSGRAAFSGPDSYEVDDEPEDAYFGDDPVSRPAGAASVDAPSSFIQDREFSTREYASGVGPADDDFSSQAERELFEALQKSSPKASGSKR